MIRSPLPLSLPSRSTDRGSLKHVKGHLDCCQRGGEERANRVIVICDHRNIIRGPESGISRTRERPDALVDI